MGSANKGVAHLEATLLDEDGGSGTATRFNLGLDDPGEGVTCRIGPQFQNFRLERDHFQKFFNAGAFGGGNFADDGLATPLFGGEAQLLQLPFDFIEVGVG